MYFENLKTHDTILFSSKEPVYVFTEDGSIILTEPHNIHENFVIYCTDLQMQLFGRVLGLSKIGYDICYKIEQVHKHTLKPIQQHALIYKPSTGQAFVPTLSGNVYTPFNTITVHIDDNTYVRYADGYHKWRELTHQQLWSVMLKDLMTHLSTKVIFYHMSQQFLDTLIHTKQLRREVCDNEIIYSIKDIKHCVFHCQKNSPFDAFVSKLLK